MQLTVVIGDCQNRRRATTDLHTRAHHGIIEHRREVYVLHILDNEVTEDSQGKVHNFLMRFDGHGSCRNADGTAATGQAIGTDGNVYCLLRSHPVELSKLDCTRVFDVERFFSEVVGRFFKVDVYD